MKAMGMRTDHVALYVIYLIADFATASSNNPLTKGNNLAFNCSEQELSLHFSLERIERNFIRSPLVTCLNLQGNAIESVKNGAFDGLPSLEYLNMAENRITDLVSFSGHENLKTLILANQYVYNDNVFRISRKYPELRYLDLSGNKISSIDWETSIYEFQILSEDLQEDNMFPKLEYLDLSNNRISQFFHYDKHSMFNLNLTHLYLHNNNLRNLDLRYFKNLIALTVDGNFIHSLNRNYCNPNSWCVSDMPKLKYLSISSNQQLQIDHDFFAFMPELATLNLSNNKLHDNIYGVFDDLISLEELNIDNNQLTNISIFKKPLQLSSLSVNGNKINHIDSVINVPNLRKLYLNNNEIKNIHKEAFRSLDLLEELHLANNSLSVLPDDWSNNLQSLRYVDLANNKFMYIESLSLSDTLPLISIDLRDNYITSFTTNILRDFPENVTIHLIHDRRNVEFNLLNK